MHLVKTITCFASQIIHIFTVPVFRPTAKIQAHFFNVSSVFVSIKTTLTILSLSLQTESRLVARKFFVGGWGGGEGGIIPSRIETETKIVNVGNDRPCKFRRTVGF